jgi:hypothetical protein
VISALRRKLGDSAANLHTVRGAGYRFTSLPSRLPVADSLFLDPARFSRWAGRTWNRESRADDRKCGQVPGISGITTGQKNPRLGTSFAAASMISLAVLSVSAASAALACSVG